MERLPQVTWSIQLLTNPCCHLLKRSRHYYSVEVMQEMMMELGRVTRDAILESGKKAVVLASNSLSHRHFTTNLMFLKT